MRNKTHDEYPEFIFQRVKFCFCYYALATGKSNCLIGEIKSTSGWSALSAGKRSAKIINKRLHCTRCIKDCATEITLCFSRILGLGKLFRLYQELVRIL